MAEETPQVLVIDDSEIAVEGMIETLRSASIPAIGMPSAIGATRTVLRHRIRVVVADVNMPVLTGNNLVSLFRNNPKLAGVKIVLVSGLAKEELVKMADECGADGVVAKDEIDLVLVTTVRRLLPRQAEKR
jgi:two-component system, sensor histidine kinase and response regulator